MLRRSSARHSKCQMHDTRRRLDRWSGSSSPASLPRTRSRCSRSRRRRTFARGEIVFHHVLGECGASGPTPAARGVRGVRRGVARHRDPADPGGASRARWHVARDRQRRCPPSASAARSAWGAEGRRSTIRLHWPARRALPRGVADGGRLRLLLAARRRVRAPTRRRARRARQGRVGRRRGDSRCGGLPGRAASGGRAERRVRLRDQPRLGRVRLLRARGRARSRVEQAHRSAAAGPGPGRGGAGGHPCSQLDPVRRRCGVRACARARARGARHRPPGGRSRRAAV